MAGRKDRYSLSLVFRGDFSFSLQGEIEDVIDPTFLVLLVGYHSFPLTQGGVS